MKYYPRPILDDEEIKDYENRQLRQFIILAMICLSGHPCFAIWPAPALVHYV